MSDIQVEKWLSSPRFAPYVAESNTLEEAAALYVWNARISAAAMETLHHVEVLLRNAIDQVIEPADHEANPEDSWLLDPTLLTPRTRSDVQTAIARIARDGKTPNRGRVIASLSFGFWRALFNKRYADLWASRLHAAFPNGSGDRSEVAGLMARLVPFRNRIAHHETLIAKPIEDYLSDMLTLASLIDPAAARWIEDGSRVPEILFERP